MCERLAFTLCRLNSFRSLISAVRAPPEFFVPNSSRLGSLGVQAAKSGANGQPSGTSRWLHSFGPLPPGSRRDGIREILCEGRTRFAHPAGATLPRNSGG